MRHISDFYSDPSLTRLTECVRRRRWRFIRANKVRRFTEVWRRFMTVSFGRALGQFPQIEFADCPSLSNGTSPGGTKIGKNRTSKPPIQYHILDQVDWTETQRGTKPPRLEKMKPPRPIQ